MSDRPRLRLDFTAPSTPPPTYSPYTYTPNSPPSPSSESVGSPKTPANRRIIMGVQVTPSTLSSDNGEIDGEESFSLEVPGIVLTEPPHPPSPRIPSPPPKQVVLLAPTSLPLPTSPLALSEKAMTGGYFSRPATLVTFMSRRPSTGTGSISPTGTGGARLRTIILIVMLVLGAWHLWNSLCLGNLVEDAFEVL